MLRTRTDLFRIMLLASVGATACGSKSDDTATTPTGNTANNSPVNNGPTGTGGSQTIGDAGPAVGGATATGGTTAAGGATAEGGATVVVSSCNSAAVLLEGDVPTGLAECDNGLVHRPIAVECPNNLASRNGGSVPNCDADGGAFCPEAIDCSSDADCTAAPYGRCMQFGMVAMFHCEYGCVTDDDCAVNQVCVCGAEIGVCANATCSVDADCGDGLLCAGYYDRFGIGCGEPMQFACQTPDDECAVDADCQPSDACNAATGTRVCTEVPGVACGRPFLVDEVARLAPTVRSRDFLTDAIELPLLDRLSQLERDVLAQAWTEIGQMEHASIAAFARFNLQLLSLGAPCSLVEECNQAIADETRHARLAFSLGSHYAARPIGPGALPLDGALTATTLAEVLDLVVVEGCIGETVAALEAAEALAHCQDDAVRKVLRQIQQDETRHAALAWRFVAWAVEQDPSLARRVAERLAAYSSPATLTATGSPRVDTLAHGILTAAVRSQVRQAALRDVILPCAAQLRLTAAPVATQTQHAA
jgi:hypothetical protein